MIGWNFAEMNDFSVCGTTYKHGCQESCQPEIETSEVSIGEIELPKRAE
jgi:hypothetical protein